MNARDFAKMNGKRAEWVRERCKEGMMPTAIKRRNGRWEIPEDAELPPCTGREATMLIENIIECTEGKSVCIVPARMARRGEAALEYLMNWGFIAKDTASGELLVLERGLALAMRFKPDAVWNADGTAQTHSSLGLKAKIEVKLPIGSALAEVDYSRERAEGAGGQEDKKVG